MLILFCVFSFCFVFVDRYWPPLEVQHRNKTQHLIVKMNFSRHMEMGILRARFCYMLVPFRRAWPPLGPVVQGAAEAKYDRNQNAERIDKCTPKRNKYCSTCGMRFSIVSRNAKTSANRIKRKSRKTPKITLVCLSGKRCWYSLLMPQLHFLARCLLVGMNCTHCMQNASDTRDMF